MLKNTRDQYGQLAKFAHWSMALLFIGMFIIAYIMINIPKSDFRMSLYDVHKATGMLLFTLVAARLSWRLINVQPDLPSTVSKWQRKFASSNIVGLYCLMIAMPVTGFLTSTLGGHIVSFYGIFEVQPLGANPSLSEFFANAHEWLSYMMMALFTLHIAGSAFHHYILKDNVVKRIWIAKRHPI